MLDEVHERHLHGDFLLGIMKCIINQKSDLKLVLMSATINIELFSNYFAKEDVKVIEVKAHCTQGDCTHKSVLINLTTLQNNMFTNGTVFSYICRFLEDCILFNCFIVL